MKAHGAFGRLLLPNVSCSPSTPPGQRARSDLSSSSDTKAFSILSHTLFSTWSRTDINPTWDVWLPLKTHHLSSYKDPEKSQDALSSVLPGPLSGPSLGTDASVSSCEACPHLGRVCHPLSWEGEQRNPPALPPSWGSCWRRPALPTESSQKALVLLKVGWASSTGPASPHYLDLGLYITAQVAESSNSSRMWKGEPWSSGRSQWCRWCFTFLLGEKKSIICIAMSISEALGQ